MLDYAHLFGTSNANEGETMIEVYLDLCMNFGQHIRQYDVH